MPAHNILRLRITVYHPGMNNNNNNNQVSLMQVRDRLFQVLFMRASLAYASLLPRLARRFIENMLLVFAFFSLFVLVYAHVMFTQTPMNCLDFLSDQWPRQGILRVEILPKPTNDSYTLKDSYIKEAQIRQLQGYSVPYFNKDDFTTKKEIEAKTVKDSSAEDSFFTSNFQLNDQTEFEKITETESTGFLQSHNDNQRISSMYKNPNHSSIADGDALSKTWYVFKSLKEKEPHEAPETEFYEDSYILEYSLEYGYLRLSPKVREKLNISVQLVTLDPKNDTCFGNSFTKMILEKFLGYDNVLMSSVRKLAEKEENKGFIRNVVRDNYFRFVNIMNHFSYAYSAIAMILFTLCISMLLRYSHHQIFVFIVQLLRLFEFRGGTSIPVAPLLTVILALVGMEAIMSEFFSDPTTSFYVILIVWIADQYDAVCCRTTIAKRHWIRFFYLYHYAFYAYDYRFSGQYSDLALFTSCSFIFHSMVYFFHHYELPDIMNALHQEIQAQQSLSEPDTLPPRLEPNTTPSTDTSSTEATSSPEETSQTSNVPETSEIHANTSERQQEAMDLPSSSQTVTDFFNRESVNPSSGVKQESVSCHTSKDNSDTNVTNSNVELSKEIFIKDVVSSLCQNSAEESPESTEANAKLLVSCPDTSSNL